MCIRDSSNIEHDIYLQNNYDNIIEEISKIYNLNLDKKLIWYTTFKKRAIPYYIWDCSFYLQNSR